MTATTLRDTITRIARSPVVVVAVKACAHSAHTRGGRNAKMGANEQKNERLTVRRGAINVQLNGKIILEEK